MNNIQEPTSPVTSEHRLFVYGTLAPGKPNEHILEDLKGDWQAATVSGTLYAEGWGAAMGYPGIVLTQEQPSSANQAEQVQGQLFTSEDLTAHWQRLDEFEGDGYQRVVAQVRLASGEQVPAYIYTLTKSPM
ncbi:gamma-glutamylcyclotransferase family protein [Thalassotalea euphylliae]|uniref:Putative gamma-glutamylcyclotransferase n=1 Tax=Thalassotalea euphylliae TaxID=1655234 RepID=A0A3E0UHK2_9GAMM|nr:gamma-glutamylcyclotransferase family protein [Thalassotalea euphylliae]REL36359.1 gamma-glutamylcyclotransferase [Thalassotalea euphylliae]